MSFKPLSTAVAFIALMLCVVLISAPQIIYWLFGLDGNDLGNFLANRAGVLCSGFAGLCYLARNTANREVKRLVSASVGTTMGVMAVLGCYEFAVGNAGAGIFLAVAVEIVIAVLFARVWMQSRQSDSAT